jgi:hypothetical protein
MLALPSAITGDAASSRPRLPPALADVCNSATAFQLISSLLPSVSRKPFHTFFRNMRPRKSGSNHRSGISSLGNRPRVTFMLDLARRDKIMLHYALGYRLQRRIFTNFGEKIAGYVRVMYLRVNSIELEDLMRFVGICGR